nr:phosphoribosylanthranilate isomerase [Gordonia shandongensis]
MGAVYVKVCGLTSVDAVEAAVRSGADAIGVVMNRSSPRALSADAARGIVAAARDLAADGPLDIVLVVNDMDAEQAARTAHRLGFTVLQLHGGRYGADDFARAGRIVPRLWRATSLADDPPLDVGAYGEERLLLDAPRPGSGRRWDLADLTDREVGGQWLLAGGLDPDNVAEAIALAQPWGVDVSSGVESAPGVKDLEAVARFVRAARSAG